MNYTIECTFKGEHIKLNVRDRISFVDIDDIAQNIADYMFDDGVYKPARFDYYYWSFVIGSYTDFDLSLVTVDDILTMVEESADRSSFIGGICRIASKAQLQRIRESAEKLIEVRLHEHPLKKICKDLHVLLDGLNKIVDQLAESEDATDIISGLLNVDQDKIVQIANILKPTQDTIQRIK